MKEFWEEQATKHGEDVAAVNFDPLQENLTAEVIDGLVADGLHVADLGCGNGITLVELAERRPRGKFVGYDYAENMVRVADDRRQKLGLRNVNFICFDATASILPLSAAGAFDVVIGKRVLINIRGKPKLQALKNVHDMLRDGGTYIMIECFIEPLGRINDIRAILGLERIAVKPFNEYLTNSFIKEVERHFTIEKVIDVGSLYYFVSRVFNAYLSGGKPEYHAPINQLASKLTRAGVRPLQGYAPEVTYVLKKRPKSLPR